LTRKPLTTPGLVDAFSDYVSIGVVPAYGRVVIAVDELDRVIQPEQVRNFLRRIKSLLTVDGVYYVMSMAEDVIESFQLRSISCKGEADSSFSEILRLGPLSTNESLDFLQRTGRELPEPSGSALAVLSAGIPRDLVRYVERLSAVARDSEASSLDRQPASFLEVEAAKAAEDFLVHVRQDPSIPPQSKATVAAMLPPPRSLGSLQKALPSLVGPLSALMPKGAGAVSRDIEPDLARLLADLGIRIAVIGRLHALAESGQLCAETAEPLRQIIEVHSYSPLEALARLRALHCAGSGLPEAGLPER
jgi:hypothetical protein